LLAILRGQHTHVAQSNSMVNFLAEVLFENRNHHYYKTDKLRIASSLYLARLAATQLLHEAEATCPSADQSAKPNLAHLHLRTQHSDRHYEVHQKSTGYVKLNVIHLT
jgi:hypothetical protein